MSAQTESVLERHRVSRVRVRKPRKKEKEEI